MRKTLFLCLIWLVPYASRANSNILLTGFWAPTNEMLREFSPDPALNGGVWIGKNWKNSGFDVYAYFPQFSGDEVGYGDFRVDFASSFNDFMRITNELKPVAVLSFGKGAGPWEIETKFPAYYLAQFRNGIKSTVGENARYPVPESLKGNRTFFSTLPVEKIRQAVNRLESPHLRAWVDHEGDAGNFLCGFMGYLNGWYQAENNSATVRMAGFIHVDGDLEKSKNNLNATLEVIVNQLNE